LFRNFTQTNSFGGRKKKQQDLLNMSFRRYFVPFFGTMFGTAQNNLIVTTLSPHWQTDVL
jgi:hypothetical protein